MESNAPLLSGHRKKSPSIRSLTTLRSVLFGTPALLILINAIVAHRQKPRPNPFTLVKTFSFDWWRYPVEHNAFKRLPTVPSSLNHLFALPDGSKVWAVGDSATIIHSADAGRRWRKQILSLKEEGIETSSNQIQGETDRPSFLSLAFAAEGNADPPLNLGIQNELLPQDVDR